MQKVNTGREGELRGESGAGVEGRADQFCCLILHRLWINVYFKTSFFPLSLRKHWHSSCWFLTFVDRDLILSNILDLLFLQWFSCTSADGVEVTGRGGRAVKVVATTQAHSSWPAAAQTQTAAILATVHHTYEHTPLHGIHTQPKSSGPTLDCDQITVSSTSVTPSLLTTHFTYFLLTLEAQDTWRRKDKHYFFTQSTLMQEWRKLLQCLDGAKYQCTNGKQSCVELRSAPVVLSDKLNEGWCYSKTQKASNTDSLKNGSLHSISCHRLTLKRATANPYFLSYFSSLSIRRRVFSS